MTNSDDIDAMRRDIEDMEERLRHLEDMVLLRLTGPLAGCLSRIHTGLNMEMLELRLAEKLLGDM